LQDDQERDRRITTVSSPLARQRLMITLYVAAPPTNGDQKRDEDTATQ
jgi:hypothetical protein